MHELLNRHRILRQKLIDAIMRNDSDPLDSHAVTRELHQSCTATMNGLLEFLEKHGALRDPERPDLLRVFAALPSEDEPLRTLEEHMDALRETIEVMALVLDERRRSSRPPISVSGVVPVAASVEEPRISWSRITPIPTDAESTDERYLVHVQRLHPISKETLDESAEVEYDGVPKKAAG
jgi:hypothetical protein